MTADDLKAVRGGETKLPPGETKLEYGIDVLCVIIIMVMAN